MAKRRTFKNSRERKKARKQCKHQSYLKHYKEWYKKACIKREERRKIVDAFRIPCLKCGEVDKVCLEFHHIDPSKKKFDVSDYGVRSIPAILEEIKKCIVICCNCHKKLHREIGGIR